MDILLWLLMLIIPVMAQLNISLTYKKYKEIDNSEGLQGFEIARKILDHNGLENVYVVETGGNLTDHYDPTRKVIKLSRDIFKGTSIAAASVAAHECGHAIQDKENYTPLRLRSMLVPVVNLVSSFSWVVIFISFFTQIFRMFLIGIGLISIGLIFQLITLPVEFNASKRALNELEKLNLVSKEENKGVSKMLSSAALTYVASVLTSIIEIIRLLLIWNSDN